MKKQISNILKFFRRSLYLLYYFKELNYRQFSHYLRFSSHITRKPGGCIFFDVLFSVYRYNISIKDYFCFRFFEQDKKQRSEWAGTGFMYEYQLIMNPPDSRVVLADKIQFLGYFKNSVKRIFATRAELQADARLSEKILANRSGHIVLKNSMGQVGAEVEVVKCEDYSAGTLVNLMRKRKYDLAEEYIIQHQSLMELSPSGVNTVRVFTQLHEGQVFILGARLRISVNSQVDNMAAGNLAAPIDLQTGVVDGPGVYSDFTKSDRSAHPITGVGISGFVVPLWLDVIKLAEEAALHTPQNRSVGWDIAITEQGPELIEGNHNWCKILWQLPVRKGLKNELVKFL